MQLEARVPAALAWAGVGPADRLAVALSGGPDSLALLILAARAAPGRVSALTVDHNLRPESAAEAESAAQAAAALGIPHATLRWTGRPHGNLQAAAREARYALMGDWCRAHGVRWLMTAHHADDQAETLFMRLARGAGLAGLTGIRPLRRLDGLTVIRPLLGARKSELCALVAEAGLTPANDPSNRDPAFDRTAARALLASTPWLDPARLASSAAHLAEAEDALAWAADRAWAGAAREQDSALLVDADGLPRALRLRLLERALTSLGASADGSDVARLLDQLDAGGTATLGGVRAEGGPPWRLTLEGQRGAS